MLNPASTPEIALPQLGYSISQVEKILNIPAKTGYRLVHSGRIAAYVDATGQLRVSPYELYAYIRNH